MVAPLRMLVLLLVLVLAAALVTSHGVAVASLPRSIPAVCAKKKKIKTGGTRCAPQPPPPEASPLSSTRCPGFFLNFFTSQRAATEAHRMNMAGPPLAPSSNVNKQKEGKTEEQSCPKRRRKSIDDSNNIPEDPGQEPTAAGETPTQTDDDGELGFGL